MKNKIIRFIHVGWHFDFTVRGCDTVEEALKCYNRNIKRSGEEVIIDDFEKINDSEYRLIKEISSSNDKKIEKFKIKKFL